MADAVNTAAAAIKLDDGNRVHCQFYNTSDGTGESAVTKVDVSTLDGAPAAVSIRRITANCVGMSVKILWDATTDVIAYNCYDGTPVDITFDPPLRNPATSGATGDIQFTTVGYTSGDTYVITLDLVKTPLT